MARMKDTRLGPQKTVFHGRRNPGKKLARRPKPPVSPKPPVWQDPDASWESHDERREEDYEGEMEYAFAEWWGTALCDLMDEDGAPSYNPPDPDPEFPGWTKKWRPYDELQRLVRVEHGEEYRPEFAAFYWVLDDFLRDETVEKNLNYGKGSGRLFRAARAVRGNNDVREQVLWVLQHCLDDRDGSLG
jgi:hypothetical protein